MNDAPALQTSRLVLEPVRANHAEEAWPLVNDERMWLFFPEKRPATPDALRELYAKWERGSANPAEIWCNWLCRDRASGLLVGAMQSTVLRNQRLAFIAYAVYPRFQRHGFAREAVQAVIDDLRSRHNIERVFAEMDIRNQASYRFAESLGFARVENRGDEYLYELKF